MLQKSLLYIGLLLGLQTPARPEWQLIKEGYGIKVYSAGAGTADFKSIKAVAVFNGTVENFLAILLDIGNQPQWVYGTRHAHLIKKVNNQEMLYYVETALPWPADNRDAVIRMRIKENKINNTLTVTSVGEPQALPVQGRKVRVPHFDARWEVKPAGKDKISLTYLLDIDPGGSLPAWITNLFVSKGPYETFRKLSDQLKK
jgi:hypothetical protein